MICHLRLVILVCFPNSLLLPVLNIYYLFVKCIITGDELGNFEVSTLENLTKLITII